MSFFYYLGEFFIFPRYEHPRCVKRPLVKNELIKIIKVLTNKLRTDQSLLITSGFIDREYFLCVLSVTTEVTQAKKLR